MGKLGFNPAVPKKSANLSINAELLRQAKALNINLSQTLEQHLAENREALDAYNRRVEEHSVFSDGLRRF